MLIKSQALRSFSLILAIALTCAVSATAQQAKVFTYQGSLTDGTAAANGTYQMEFRLFNSETNGKPLQVINNDAVKVANGVFKVDLNLAANIFDGAAARYLEIAVRKSSEAEYITLPTRQLVNNSPYSIKTLNATFDGDKVSAVNDGSDELSGGNRVVLTGRPATAITYTTGQVIAGRTVTINKAFADTALKITYMETFERPATSNGINGQLFITVDGIPTYGNPGIISAIAFPVSNASFNYGQANIIGYALYLLPGNHTIGVTVASNSVRTFTSFQYLLEVEEVRGTISNP